MYLMLEDGGAVNLLRVDRVTVVDYRDEGDGWAVVALKRLATNTAPFHQYYTVKSGCTEEEARDLVRTIVEDINR